MSAETADPLIEQVLLLPYEKRIELYERLRESLHPEGENIDEDEHRAAWSAELLKRIAASDGGERGVPAEDVFARLEARDKNARPAD